MHYCYSLTLQCLLYTLLKTAETNSRRNQKSLKVPFISQAMQSRTYVHGLKYTTRYKVESDSRRKPNKLVELAETCVCVSEGCLRLSDILPMDGTIT